MDFHLFPYLLPVLFTLQTANNRISDDQTMKLKEATLSLCFLRPNYRMLRGVGKNYRTLSTALMLRERSSRPQNKVIPNNVPVLPTVQT